MLEDQKEQYEFNWQSDALIDQENSQYETDKDGDPKWWNDIDNDQFNGPDE